jgi:hypothetical protein
VLAGLVLGCGPALLTARDIEPAAKIKNNPSAALKWAPRQDGRARPATSAKTSKPTAAKSPAKPKRSTSSSSAATARDTKQALSSNLRWKSHREARRSTTQTPARAEQPAETREQVADHRAAHLAAEANHVVQTSGTKPRDNAFDDPFFADQAAETVTKPEPIVLPALEPSDSDPFQKTERIARRQPAPDRGTDLEPGVDPLDLGPEDEAVDRAAEEMPGLGDQLEQPESELGNEAPQDETVLPDESLDETTPAAPRQPTSRPPATITPPSNVGDLDSGAIQDSFREPQALDPGQTDWDQEMAQLRGGQQPPACRKPEEILKRIRDITSDISADAGDFPPECPLGDAPFEPRMWQMTAFHWKASGLCHKPLYFEQVGVERYGHSLGPILQPIWSGVDFYGRIFLLPYEMGIEPPWECVYALGYYRPGSCAPKMIFPFPVSIRGGLLEAGAVLGAVYLLP